MDLGKIITAITAIVVMIVLVVTVAVPVLSSLESTSEPGENVPPEMATAGRLNLGGSHTLTVEDDGPHMDSEPLTGLKNGYSLAVGNTFNITYGSDGKGTVEITGISNDTYFRYTISPGESVSMADGTATYTPAGGGEATTFNYTKLYYYDEDGEYGTYGYGNIVVSPSTTVTGFFALGDICFVDVIDGEIVDATAYSGSHNGDTATERIITEAMTGYTENDDGTVSYTTPFQFLYSGGDIMAIVIAPYHYGGTDQGEIGDIIAVMPVIMVVGILIAAIGVFIPLRS